MQGKHNIILHHMCFVCACDTPRHGNSAVLLLTSLCGRQAYLTQPGHKCAHLLQKQPCLLSQGKPRSQLQAEYVVSKLTIGLLCFAEGHHSVDMITPPIVSSRRQNAEPEASLTAAHHHAGDNLQCI